MNLIFYFQQKIGNSYYFTIDFEQELDEESNSWRNEVVKNCDLVFSKNGLKTYRYNII